MEMDALLHQNQQLKAELEATKFALLETQARLHQVQEELERAYHRFEDDQTPDQPDRQMEATRVQLQQLESVLNQVQGQYRYAQHQLLAFKACVSYGDGDRLRMVQYFEQTLDGSALEPQALVADWLKNLHQFCQEKHLPFDLLSLVNSAEWKALMQQVIS